MSVRQDCLEPLKRIAERTDSVMSDISHQVFDPLIAGIRERLGEAEFNRLWAEGRKLTLEQALELAKQ